MILTDPELQAKIDAVDDIRLAIGGNMFAALSQAIKIEELFPTKKNGDERTGKQDTQGQPEVQEVQASPDPETGSTDTPH